MLLLPDPQKLSELLLFPLLDPEPGLGPRFVPGYLGQEMNALNPVLMSLVEKSIELTMMVVFLIVFLLFNRKGKLLPS